MVLVLLVNLDSLVPRVLMVRSGRQALLDQRVNLVLMVLRDNQDHLDLLVLRVNQERQGTQDHRVHQVL